jgi:hypothetical protein
MHFAPISLGDSLFHVSIIHCFLIMYLWYYYVGWIMGDVILRLGIEDISHLYLELWEQGSRCFHAIPEIPFPGFCWETGYPFLTQDKGNTKHLCPELANRIANLNCSVGALSALYGFLCLSSNSCFGSWVAFFPKNMAVIAIIFFMVECLLCKCKVLRANPSPNKQTIIFLLLC